MVNNNTLFYVDRLGLAPVACEKVYVVGHGPGMSDVIDEFNKNKNSCSSISGNACNRDGANGSNGIPGFKPTPDTYFGVNYSGNNEYSDDMYGGNAGMNPGSHGKSDADQAVGFVKLVMHNWTKTVEAADASAENCGCNCVEVVAKFQCESPFTTLNMQRAFDVNLKHPNRVTNSFITGLKNTKENVYAYPTCGAKVTFKCKKNAKKS